MVQAVEKNGFTVILTAQVKRKTMAKKVKTSMVCASFLYFVQN